MVQFRPFWPFDMADSSSSQLPGSRVLIAGNYGYGNAGDEALLSGCLGVLQQARPDVELQVVSGDPASTAALHEVRACSWNDLHALRAAVGASDLVVLGGGGLFHDYWGFDPRRILSEDQGHLARYFRVPLLATAAGKPLALLALGVGPLRYREARLHTRLAFEQASSASVRDAASRDLLAEIGVDEDRVTVTADPAFALPRPTAAEIEVARQVATADSGEGPRLAIAVRPWQLGPPPESWMTAVAHGLDGFLEAAGGHAVFLPFQSKTAGDRDAARAIQARMRQAARTSLVEETLAPRELLAQVAAADLVLAMRLHSLIFAIHSGVPAVALSYDPKVASLLAEMELSRLGVALDAVNGEALAASLATAWRQRQDVGAAFRRHGKRLAEQARHGTEAVAALLERSAEPSSRGRSPQLETLLAGVASLAARPRESPPEPAVESASSPDIVCFSIVNWEFRRQRPQQMMALWGRRGRRVFFLRVSDFLPPDGEPFAVKPLAENVWEVRIALPKGFSIHSGSHPQGFVAAGMEALRALRRVHTITEAVSFVQAAGWTPLARAAREAFGWPLLYDCMDDWSTFPETSARPPLLALEEELAATADLMVVSADNIRERWAGRRPDALLVRNGADFAFFQNTAGDDPLPEIHGAVAGFFGGIAEWFDVELVAHVARARPEVTFVLVGGVHRISVEELEELPNVRLEGLQPYARMPAYLRRFDACLIPFRISPLTDAVDPVKLYEYLSQGKPVVATRFREITPFGELVYLAEDRDDFVRHLDRALVEDDPAMRERRIDFARRNTWGARLDEIDEAIRERLAKRQSAARQPAAAPSTEELLSLRRSAESWRAEAEALRRELRRWQGSRLWRVANVYWRSRRALGRLLGRARGTE